MDISKLNAGASDGEKMYVKHPVTGKNVENSDGSSVYITLVSRDHPSVQSIWKHRLDDLIRDLQSGGKDKEENDSDLDILVAATKDWNFEEYAGQKNPKCEPSVIRRVFKEQVWLREQANAFFATRANFLKASS